MKVNADQEQFEKPYCQTNLRQNELIQHKLGEQVMTAYGLAIADCNYIDDKLQETVKELSDFKFALDAAAIVAITDQKGIIRYVNDKFCQLSQYSRDELMGEDHRIINSGHHSREFFQNFWSSLRTGKVWKGEIKNRAKDGTYYWVDTTVVPFLNDQGKPYQYLSIRFDITERKQVEEALREAEAKSRYQAQQLEMALHKLQRTQSHLVHSEKLSSMGQLIAGIAHEINNPVNFIYGNLMYTSEYIQNLLEIFNLYQQHYPNPASEIQTAIEENDMNFLLADLPKMLNSMQLGADRIREIVLSLRNFSRLDESEMKPVDIHEGIDSTLLILQNRLKAKGEEPKINVFKEYGNLPLVTCYPSQLNQVFMNLISNAIDALEKQPAPRIITIKTEHQSADSVSISIADNGLGIPEQIQKNLFDPFFTTKPVGKGTGLGLSIAHQIVVEKHQGQLDCISQHGQGVEFLISIPISPAK